MEPLPGTIILFEGNFEPCDWASCDGQAPKIARHPALYSLLGMTRGGDGITTFRLPDLRGRVHAGPGTGLSPRSPGETFGSETVPPVASRVPPHNHDLGVAEVPRHSDRGQGDMAARSQILSDGNRARLTPNPLSIALTGGCQPHDSMRPGLCVN